MKLAAVIAAGALFLLPAASSAFAASDSDSGSDRGISSVGRDLVVSGRVPGRVVAVASDVRIEGAVAGDVIVWGGDVTFGPAGTIAGNLVVFGGAVKGREGSRLPVAGTVSTPGTLLQLYLSETGKAPWEAAALSPVVWGLRLLALAAWLAIAVALLYFFGSPLARAAHRAEANWGAALAAGALGVLSLFLAAAAALALLPSALSVPIALFLGAAAIAAKVFGISALFLLVGQKITESFAPSRRPAALALGFAVLGGISLLPIAGAIAWSAISIAAVGVAFLSRFGAARMRIALG